MRTKQNRHSKFIERFWAHQDMRYSRLKKLPQKSADIPLQNLDAHLLLQTVHDKQIATSRTDVNPSPAGSSLDLEWEHEYANASQQPWLLLPEQIAIDELSSEEDSESSDSSKNTSNIASNIKIGLINHIKLLKDHTSANQRTSSRSSWSHISTPDSLEWDVNGDEQQYKSEDDLLDNETMELLHEIEWLKNRALNETGETLRDSSNVLRETES